MSTTNEPTDTSEPATDSDTDSTTKSDEKVPEELARAFEDASRTTNGPSKLTLDKATAEEMGRETDNKMVGKVYECPTYGCKAYYSTRDASKHFMFKYRGYAVDDVILQELDEMGVEKVFIGVRNDRTVLEYDLQQFLDEDTFDEGWGVQRCPPKSDAKREWPNAVGNIFDEE